MSCSPFRVPIARLAAAQAVLAGHTAARDKVTGAGGPAKKTAAKKAAAKKTTAKKAPAKRAPAKKAAPAPATGS